MSQSALVQAARDILQAAFGWGTDVCALQFDGMPPPIAGELFVAVHAGSWSNIDCEGLGESIGFHITVTRRAAAYPKDEGMMQIWAAAQTGLDAVCRAIVAKLHLDANKDALINAANVYCLAQNLGAPVNGFVVCPRFRDGGTPTVRGPDWFSAEGDDGAGTFANAGISQTITFAGAERYQTIESMAGGPLAPTGFTLTPGVNQMTLAWTLPAGTLTQIQVFRGTSSGQEILLATLAPNIVGYVDTSAIGGTTYYYFVQAANAVGPGLESSEGVAQVIPGAPTNMAAAAGVSSISLSWTLPTGTISAIQVWRGTSSGGETLLATLAGTATSYVDSAVSTGVTYYYYTVAVGTIQTGPPSSEVSAEIPTLTNFALTPGKGTNSITMTVPAGIASLAVRRAVAGTGTYGNQSTITVASLPYVDSSPVAGTGYDYQFACFIGAAQGPWQGPVTTWVIGYNTFQTTGAQTSVNDNLGNPPSFVNASAGWNVATAGQLTQTGTATLTYAMLWNLGSIDFVANIALTPPNIADFQMGWRFRCWGSDYCFIAIERDGSGTPYILVQRLINGSSITNNIATTITLGTAAVLTIQALGPVITVLWNGTQVGQVNYNYPLGTLAGLATYRDGSYGAVTVTSVQVQTFSPILSPFSAIQFRSTKGIYYYPSNPIIAYNTVADNVGAQDSVWRGPVVEVGGTYYGMSSNTDGSGHTYLCGTSSPDPTFTAATQLGVLIAGVASGTTWMKNLLLQPYVLVAPNVPPVFGNVQGVVYFGAQDNTGALYQQGAFTFTAIGNAATYAAYSGNPIFTAGSSTTGQWLASVFQLPGGTWQALITGNFGGASGADLFTCSMGTGASPGTTTKVFPANYLVWETSTSASRENPALSTSLSSTPWLVGPGVYEMQWTSFGACPYNGFVCQLQGAAISPDGINWKFEPWPIQCPDRNRNSPMWGQVGDNIWSENAGVAYVPFAGQLSGTVANCCLGTLGNGMGWVTYPAALASSGAPPTALTATVGAGAGAASIALSATAPSGSPTGYNWDKSPAGFGHWDRVSTAGAISITDANSLVNFGYDIRCQAVFAGGASQWQPVILQAVKASDPSGAGNCNWLLIANRCYSDVWLTQKAVNNGPVAGIRDWANQTMPMPAQQATAAKQPTYNSSTGGVVFNGSQWLLCNQSSPSTPSTGNPDGLGASSVTLHVCMQAAVLNVLQYFFGSENQSGASGSRSGGVLLGIDANGYLIVKTGIGGGEVGGVTAFPDGINYTATYLMNTSPKLITLVFDAAGGFTLYVNGVSEYTAAGNKVLYQGNYAVLGGQATTRGANGFSGTIFGVSQYPANVATDIANEVAFWQSIAGMLG